MTLGLHPDLRKLVRTAHQKFVNLGLVSGSLDDEGRAFTTRYSGALGPLYLHLSEDFPFLEFPSGEPAQTLRYVVTQDGLVINDVEFCSPFVNDGYLVFDSYATWCFTELWQRVVFTIESSFVDRSVPGQPELLVRSLSPREAPYPWSHAMVQPLLNSDIRSVTKVFDLSSWSVSYEPGEFTGDQLSAALYLDRFHPGWRTVGIHHPEPTRSVLI